MNRLVLSSLVAPIMGSRLNFSHCNAAATVHPVSSYHLMSRPYKPCRPVYFHSQTRSDPRDSLEPITQCIDRVHNSTDRGTLFVVKVPPIGNEITYGKIQKWYKTTGDYVDVGDLLCVIETEQVLGKVHSQVSGTIIETVGDEGCKVKVGSDLTIIRKEGDVDSEEELEPEEELQ